MSWSAGPGLGAVSRRGILHARGAGAAALVSVDAHLVDLPLHTRPSSCTARRAEFAQGRAVRAARSVRELGGRTGRAVRVRAHPSVYAGDRVGQAKHDKRGGREQPEKSELVFAPVAFTVMDGDDAFKLSKQSQSLTTNTRADDEHQAKDLSDGRQLRVPRRRPSASEGAAACSHKHRWA